MQLKVSYRNGSARVVNLHPDFFKKTEVKDRYKTTIVTPEQKAQDIAHSGGANIHELVLTNGTDVVYRETYRHNKPEVKVALKPAHEWVGFMEHDNDITMKDVKELKKSTFTKKWDTARDPMPWERTINLMLTHIK